MRDQAHEGSSRRKSGIHIRGIRVIDGGLASELEYLGARRVDGVRVVQRTQKV